MEASSIAPWIATIFGVGAAVAAEQSFLYGNKGSTPDRWRGSDLFYTGFDHDHESDERMARDCAREIAAASQATATYLAAGAAVQAAAASQQGHVAFALTVIGLLCVVPIVKRGIHAIDEIRWLEAWYFRGKWDGARKWVHSQHFDEEDALFARDHPKEAAVLAKRKVDRTAQFDIESYFST